MRFSTLSTLITLACAGLFTQVGAMPASGGQLGRREPILDVLGKVGETVKGTLENVLGEKMKNPSNGPSCQNWCTWKDGDFCGKEDNRSKDGDCRKWCKPDNEPKCNVKHDCEGQKVDEVDHKCQKFCDKKCDVAYAFDRRGFKSGNKKEKIYCTCDDDGHHWD